MLKTVNTLISSLALAVMLIFPLHLFAQININNEDFAVKISPEFPSPLSEVRAEANSFTFDINRASVRWIVNGKTIAQGTGVKEASFKTRGLGSADVLRVVVSPQEGGTLEKTITVYPAMVDMLIEAKGFIPEWYKGARLLTPGGEYKVTAIPHFVSAGARLKPETLTYNWKVGGRVRGDLSGRGRQSITMKTAPIQKVRAPVSVIVSSPQETFRFDAATFVESGEPELLFYERPPLAGVNMFASVNEKRLTGGDSVKIEAAPFFMNISSMNDLKFSWKFDDKKIDADPAEPHRFIVDSVAGTRGSAALELVITGIKNMFEEVRSSLNVYAE